MINKVNTNILAYASGLDVLKQSPRCVADNNDTLSFKANYLYNGPYNNAIMLTDFNDATSNFEATLRLNDVLNYVTFQRKNRHSIKGFQWDNEFKKLSKRTQGTLEINTFTDIPCGNKDYAAMSLLRLGSRPNKDIFIHVVDPGVGNGTAQKLTQNHDRSILISKKHGIFIGPNNGSLGLLQKYLIEIKDEFRLHPINLRAVEAFERIRLANPYYILPETFHGRDVFSVVAGAVLGGINPEAFVDKLRVIKECESEFAKGITSLTEIKKDEVLKAIAIVDQTCGNIKTNLILTAEQAQKLLEENAFFEIATTGQQGGLKFEIPFKKSFSDVPKGKDLIYLGSSYAPVCENGNLVSRFVEIATNAGHFGRKIAVENHHAIKFIIRRVR